MTNLQIVQKISKVLGIICRVFYILCMVGAIASLVGVVLTSVAFFFPSLVDRVEQDSGVRLFEVMGYCLSGLVVCIAGVIVSKAHRDYFLKEQEVGTPFTKEGALAFRTLGIMNIIVPVITMVIVPVITMVIVAVISAIFKTRDVSFYASLGTGVAMILLSYVLAYGAELEEKKAGAAEDSPEEPVQALPETTVEGK